MADSISFSGSIPEIYDKNLGPLLFEQFAIDLIERIENGSFESILELACGTGIVTKYLTEIIPADKKIVVSDLNPDMLEVAKKKVKRQNVEWKVIDMHEIPFDDSTFDLVVMQFGIMFVPDKEKVFKEIYRVLKPGGKFLFNVWQSLEKNPIANITNEVVNRHFKDNPVTFYQIPFSYHNESEVRKDLTNAGFKDISMDELHKTNTSVDSEFAAKGLLEGNPVVLQIKERNPDLLMQLRKELQEELKQKLGDKPMKAELNTIVFEGIK